MLVRAVYLSATWFALSMLGTVAMGARLRREDVRLSLLWLIAIIIGGDLVAIFTFGQFLEIAVLSLLAFLCGAFWIFQLRDWNAAGQATWCMTVFATAVFLIYAALLTAFSPLNPLSFVFALILFFLEAVNLLLALAHIYEGLDISCRLRWHRRDAKLEPIPAFVPMVSLHVPAHNEPLEVMQRTIHSLAKLDYPNYEVLIVDNNTPLEETWRPLEAICRAAGPQFRCLHVERWPGYKSGALNFAIAQTDPRAEIVGIIDADYEVEPNFLRELVPAFADPGLAFVQTPQDYRDYQKDIFSESTYRGYKYFFEVSMPCRNEHNAIILAGTMGLIRKSVLEEIGGWDEWCITEDAEASLRILKRGYQSLYIHKVFGHGLMPFDFESLKKQRFRWCFGGIQILKKHWESLMPWARWVDPENKLTAAQRYYYLFGGLGWFTDLFNLLFAFFLVLGAIFSLFSGSIQIRPLASTILVVPAMFLLLHLVRFLWVLRNRLRISLGKAIATMYNFYGLGWAVTLACIQGLIQREGTFLRTPKSVSTSRFWHALQTTQWETAIGWVCVAAGAGAVAANQNWRMLILCLLLFWQGSLYLAAPVYSLLGRNRAAAPSVQVTDQGKPVLEKSAARWVVALFMAMVGAFSLITLLPLPSALPQYAALFPSDPPTQSTPRPVPKPVIIQPQKPVRSAWATVSIESTYCWSGPGGKGYKKLFPLFRNQKMPILGRSQDLGNVWWYVTDQPTGTNCWLWGFSATTTGPVDKVPIITPGN